MSSLITNATIQIRKDTAGNWTSNNPTPAAGEWCLETDTKAVKIGDGSTAWTSLIYIIWPLSRARATRATAQSMANGAFTKVIFNTEVFDNLAEYDNTTGVFTATYTGYYQVNAAALSANVTWGAGEVWIIGLHKNGVIYSNGSRMIASAVITSQLSSNYSDIVYLVATDYIDMRIFQNQGAAVNIHNDATYNYFSVHRLS